MVFDFFSNFLIKGFVNIFLKDTYNNFIESCQIETLYLPLELGAVAFLKKQFPQHVEYQVYELGCWYCTILQNELGIKYSVPILYSESSKLGDCPRLFKLLHTERKSGKPKGEGGLGEMEIMECP